MTSSASRGRATRPAFHCTECGYAAAKWVGRCPECHAWGSLTEAGASKAMLRKVTAGPVSAPARPMAGIDATSVAACPSGLSELDRVLGGGLVPGGVVLMAGEPGVGKSTLLLSAAQAWAAGGQGPALIVTGEESVAQVRLRADRIGALDPNLYLAAESELSAVLGHIDAVAPRLIIIDSVQTIAAAEVEGSAGGVTQVRAVAAALTAVAKERGIACVLVGHVTKDGAIAGPRVLEHLVDVVLHFEGDRHSSLRLVRGIKNRFGPSDEVGCFLMTEDGIVGLSDPSGLFLSGRNTELAGTCSTIAMHGRRAMPVELQALLGPKDQESGRRVISGLDSSRVTIALAVLERFGGVRIGKREVLGATLGGAKMTEPAADLAFSMAVWSSSREVALPAGMVVMGEVGLSGDIRRVSALDRRLAEAVRLGFDHAVVPVRSDFNRPAGMRISEVATIQEAFRSDGSGDATIHWLNRRGG